MKKFLQILFSLLMLISLVACSTKEEAGATIEQEPEPVRYSDTFYLVSKDYKTLEELSLKTIGFASEYENDVFDYVKEEIASVIEVSDDTFYDYHDYQSIPNELGNMDAFIVPGDVHDSLLNDYRPDYLPKEFTVIAEYNKPYFEEEIVPEKIKSSDLYTKPFAVMIDGIDGAGKPDANAYLRNDVNHLMIVDPVRNHITMISFPRDSYVLNNKTGRYDKLTHHGLNGVENIKRSVGGVLDAEIEYYMQVSFSSFVEMIGVIGGVWVDVPLRTYMDMDSNRDVSKPYEIQKGYQKLFGEETLALARNRKYANIYNSDCGRLRNQALIITSIIEKISKHPRLLKMAHADWWFDYLTCNNFNDEEFEVLIALAKKFAKEGYTTDNYFMDGTGDMAGDMYVYKLYDSSIEIAKGKYQLAMNGNVDKDSRYYDEILTGWINKGTGTYDDGYLGEEYDLRSIFGIEDDKEVEITDTVEAEEVSGEQTE